MSKTVIKTESNGLLWLAHKDNTFGQVRKHALKFWLDSSGRFRDENTKEDNFANSEFCKLQGRVVSTYGEHAHLALYCNLGDWCSHITDILHDSSLDDLNLTDLNHSRQLFRYYSRLMLIISEVVDDVAKVILFVSKTSKKKGRTEIANGDELMGFVNMYVKHKSENSHCYDHHKPIVFEDNLEIVKDDLDITFGNLVSKNSDRFRIPPLTTLIEIALESERKLAKFLEDNTNFEKIFIKYKGVVSQ